MPLVVQSNVWPSWQAANLDNCCKYLAWGHLELSTNDDFVQDKHVLTMPIDCSLLSTSNKKQKADTIAADPVVDGNSNVKNDRPEPLSPSTKIRRANIVSRHASELIIFKQGIGEGCIQEYGADKHFFFQHKFLYRDWLNLGSIKSAASDSCWEKQTNCSKYIFTIGSG